MNTRTHAALALVAALIAPGCVTEQMLRQEVLDQRALIGELRQENTNLESKLESATYEEERLRQALEEAARLSTERASVQPAAAPAPVRQYGGADLDQVGVSVEQRGDDVVFTIPSAITFGSGSADLSKSGEEALLAVSSRLKRDFGPDTYFYIEGHTDSDRIRRSKFTSNRDLSWARARAVHEFIVTRGEIEDSRFVVVGHGPYRPLASNDNDAGKAKNRRVELIVRTR